MALTVKCQQDASLVSPCRRLYNPIMWQGLRRWYDRRRGVRCQELWGVWRNQLACVHVWTPCKMSQQGEIILDARRFRFYGLLGFRADPFSSLVEKDCRYRRVSWQFYPGVSGSGYKTAKYPPFLLFIFGSKDEIWSEKLDRKNSTILFNYLDD